MHAENLGGDIELMLGKRCLIGAFPWRYEGLEGCPCRIVCFLDTDIGRGGRRRRESYLRALAFFLRAGFVAVCLSCGSGLLLCSVDWIASRSINIRFCPSARRGYRRAAWPTCRTPRCGRRADRLFELMGDHDRGAAAFARQLQEGLAQGRRCHLVEMAERLVGQQHRAGQRKPAPSQRAGACRRTARGVGIGETAKPEAIEPDERPLVLLVSRQAEELERQPHVVERGAPRQQAVLLEHGRDPAAEMIEIVVRRLVADRDRPAVGASRPIIRSKNVDLPQPVWPTIATISRGAMRIEPLDRDHRLAGGGLPEHLAQAADLIGGGRLHVRHRNMRSSTRARSPRARTAARPAPASRRTRRRPRTAPAPPTSRGRCRSPPDQFGDGHHADREADLIFQLVKMVGTIAGNISLRRTARRSAGTTASLRSSRDTLRMASSESTRNTGPQTTISTKRCGIRRRGNHSTEKGSRTPPAPP